MTLAVTLTIEQLRDLVREACRLEIESVRIDAEDVLTSEQTAELLKVCTKTLQDLVHRHGLPASRLVDNGPFRFVRSEVIAWVQAHRFKPKPKLRSVGGPR